MVQKIMSKQSGEVRSKAEFLSEEAVVSSLRLGKYFPIRTGLTIAFVLWAIFSVLYISLDQFARFRYTLITQSYQSARQDLLHGFIAEATKKTCDTVSLTDGTTQVTVVNVDCLKPAAASAEKPASK
jgi:hypothetical protein